jgi:hypothetical protein
MTPLRKQKERKDDHGARRYKPFLHWLGGIYIGWNLSKMFPEEERLLGVVDLGIDWLLAIPHALGGTAALGSLLLVVLPFVKWLIERKGKK